MSGKSLLVYANFVNGEFFICNHAFKINFTSVLNGCDKLGCGAVEVNNTTAWTVRLETGAKPSSLCISIFWEGFLTTNICMINLWTLALPAWLNTLHFAKNSMSASTVSIHIHLGKLQVLELCYGTEDKKSFVSCQLDISSTIYFIGDKRKVLLIFNTVFHVLLFGLWLLQSGEKCQERAQG